MTQEDNFKNLCNLTTSVLGLRKGSLAYKSRKQELQVARMIASVIARSEYDTHQTVIAKVINRNRSLIYHYEKKHSQNYASFPKYRDIFNKVHNSFTIIEESKKIKEDSKKVFTSIYKLREHLRKNNVIESNKHQVTVRLVSGKIGLDVKLSYRDFTKQLELIKEALNGYKFKHQIITL
tara:strand:+ start:133 stop:669 length:537 start_codon:yes stop_codon:yes gene_type:complete